MQNLRKLIPHVFGYSISQGCEGIEKSRLLPVAYNVSVVLTHKVLIRLRTL